MIELEAKKTMNGLREQIKQSNSLQEINDLLVIGTQFKYAAARTRRAWETTAKTAKQRIDKPFVPILYERKKSK